MAEIGATAFEAKLLDIDDEIARNETRVFRHLHIYGNVNARHHELAVFIHEIQF